MKELMELGRNIRVRYSLLRLIVGKKGVVFGLWW